RVFAVDFDLEAPGLHYKLNLDKSAPVRRSPGGLTDYVHTFATRLTAPNSLLDYVVEVEKEEGVRGAIRLMPAGDVLSPGYWRKLAEINWHDLFYSETARGVAAFLDLKARIEEEFNPDYLLIDSRTGVTEIGGVATTILPDYVICLLLSNQENLDGARAAMRSIVHATRTRGQAPINVIPVLARTPFNQDRESEAARVSQVREFLNEEAGDLAETLHFEELDVLHTDRELELQESLLIVTGLSRGAYSPLFYDYIRLITRFVPKETLAPYIEPLVTSALESAWDEPDRSEQVLTALAEYSADSRPFEALVKFHGLRKADKSTLLQAAARRWQITRRADDAFLQKTVRDNFDWDLIKEKSTQPARLPDGVSIEFLKQIWYETPKVDCAAFGAELAEALLKLKRPAEAVQIALETAEIDDGDTGALNGCLRVLASIGKVKDGLEIIDRRIKGAAPPDLQATWARLVLASGDPSRAIRFVDRPDVDRGPLMDREFTLYVKLQLLAERADQAEAEVGRYLSRFDPREFGRGLRDSELLEVVETVGLFHVLEEKLRIQLGSEMAAEVLRRARRAQGWVGVR
ncbi:MAG TPA: hypothetical protein VJX67_08135, partial [Blastocatellia bacterium]|nr:hypothetical protein [Blastocatellia bacterium]